MNNLSDFDKTKIFVGKLCPKGHRYNSSDNSLRYINRGRCVECARAENNQRYVPKRPPTKNYCPIDLSADFVDSIFYLGRLCNRKHDYRGSGLSKRRVSNYGQGNCLECQKLVSKQYYERNHDEILLKQREYLSNNKDKVRQKKAEYYARNADHVKAKAKSWRENNRERRRENNREWAIRNPEKDKNSKRNWRQSHRGAQKEKDLKRRQRLVSQSDMTLTIDAVDKLYASSSSCPYCGVSMTDGRGGPDIKSAKSIDHMVPLVLGGLHSLQNVIVCCLSCNSKKGNKPYSEWVEGLSEPYRSKAEALYIKKHGSPPCQLLLPFTYQHRGCQQ